MHFKFGNINDAFKNLCFGIHTGSIHTTRTTSRNGDVLQIPEPVIITYENPTQRVLFNESRDCNPFMHVMEALWMLAGRNELAPLKYYVSTFGDYSDDGKTLNGAYGFRWRRAKFYDEQTGQNQYKDQLPIIIDQLKRKPDSRRVVLQMWNVEDDLLKIDTSKDVCCNLSILFLVTNGKLDMTVFNRSNDLVWGALGANVVHMSFLHEYIAQNVGIPLGVYNQVSNNMHVYTAKWEPEKYLADATPDYYVHTLNLVPLIKDPKVFERELPTFVNHLGEQKFIVTEYQEPFFKTVALPMVMAFNQHKARDYTRALQLCSEIMDDAWRISCTTWISKRKATYQRAHDDGPSHDKS